MSPAEILRSVRNGESYAAVASRAHKSSVSIMDFCHCNGVRSKRSSRFDPIIPRLQKALEQARRDHPVETNLARRLLGI